MPKRYFIIFVLFLGFHFYADAQEYPQARIMSYDALKLNKHELAKFGELLQTSNLYEAIKGDKTLEVRFKNSVILWIFPNEEAKREVAANKSNAIAGGFVKRYPGYFTIDEATRTITKLEVQN